MKHFFLLLLVAACATKPHSDQKAASSADFFLSQDLNGCFLIYNVKAAKLEKDIGNICDQRFPASSTFKVPLSVMAFDAGILKSEKEVYAWDGKKGMMDAWNRDHNAETWMKESVVWFSKRLTPQLGEKRLQEYLDKFNYGNRNLKAGITEAWLVNANEPYNALAINPREQLEFMKKLFSGTLPASQKSQEITRKIMYIETLPNGFNLHGKTGSNFFDPEKKHQLGWFIAHFSRGDREYVTVMTIADRKPFEGQGYGGFRARALTKKLFDEHLKQNQIP